ncbi:succinylglutamate desuccinylase [Haloarchaeobius sp. TZWWS8]|uniref:succinylglutamate desuccinylase n=1 Tax=Haloarchaeobius sp. TZWWS8 TaxID=3446121 RepID=UPI003EB8D69F
MKVTVLGDGEPAVAVVAAVHGDEPCGVDAVERVLDEAPEVQRPVKFVVANEEALARGERYLESDLNRSFPGDPDGDTHEERLAAELTEELAGCRTLALHSTQSHADPFAVVDGVDEVVETVCPRLPIEAVVETGAYVEGRMFNAVSEVVEVECGLQGSDEAAENGYQLVRAFLTATGVLPGEQTPSSVPVFRLVERVPKGTAEEYEVFVPNFQRVDAGEPFAAADGREEVAEVSFYPVLMSPYGYEDVFGYSAERIGVVD